MKQKQNQKTKANYKSKGGVVILSLFRRWLPYRPSLTFRGLNLLGDGTAKFEVIRRSCSGRAAVVVVLVVVGLSVSGGGGGVPGNGGGMGGLGTAGAAGAGGG